MDIGIIGSGYMGASMGKAWAAKGHQVLFSFSQDVNPLPEVAAVAGPNARSGAPAAAVAFGDVILLSVPWAAVADALKAAGAFAGKILFSCVNCLKPDFSGLAVGTTTSAAEEIARQAPDARSKRFRQWLRYWRPMPIVSQVSRSARSTAAMMPKPRLRSRRCCAISTSNRSTRGR